MGEQKIKRFNMAQNEKKKKKTEQTTFEFWQIKKDK